MRSGVLVSILLTMGAIAQELPDEARVLVEAHEKDVRRLQLAYLLELDGLAARYRAANQPEKAKAVAELIETTEKGMVGKESEGESVLKPLIGTWRRNTDGKIWKFDSAKAGSFNGKQAFTMTYDAEKNRVVVKAEKWVNTLEFTDDENVMSGSWKENGEKTFELTRVK